MKASGVFFKSPSAKPQDFWTDGPSSYHRTDLPLLGGVPKCRGSISSYLSYHSCSLMVIATILGLLWYLLRCSTDFWRLMALLMSAICVKACG